MLAARPGTLGQGQAGGFRMSEPQDEETCLFCKKGHLRKTAQEIAFHQWTDKGYIFCRVTVPLGICDACGWRDWNDDAEAVIEAAVRRESNKLP
jgi:hypothetical protein